MPSFKVYHMPERRIQRFLSFIAIDDNCWKWVGSLNADGYGRFTLRKNKTIGAHRVSYQVFKGSDNLENSLVCHTCDNPACVNPNHLYLGSEKTNTDDRYFRQRSPTKLSLELVLEVKEKYATGLYTQKDIASMYNVDQSCISRAITGTRWSDYL